MLNNLLPQKEVVIKIDVSKKEEILKNIQSIFNDLNWTISKIDENTIQGTTSITLSSWGETIDVSFDEDQLKITSKCVGNQILDWNKNKENITLFLKKFDEYNFGKAIVREEEKNIKEQLLIHEPVVKEKKLLSFLSIFIPTKDYFFTPLIAILNIIFFLVMTIDGTNIINPEIEKLIFWGANERSLTLNGELWRLITSTFMHIGIVHLLMNLYALLFIGSLLEPTIGKIRFLIIYFLTAIVASVSSLWWHKFSISAGASGAIFGLFGVFLSLLLFNQVDKQIKRPMLFYISIYIGFNLLNGMKEGIDGAAHIGGLVSGFIFGLTIIYGIKNEESKELNYWILGILSFLTLSTSFLVIESIPNPLKYYNKHLKNDINYFELYDLKMKEFYQNEGLAMEIETYQPRDKEDALLFIKDRCGYYWKENLKIVKEIEKYSLPEEILDRNKEIKKYTLLRMKQLNLVYKKVYEESVLYDKEILELNQEIEFQISKILNL